MSLKFNDSSNTVQGEKEKEEKQQKFNQVVNRMAKDVPVDFSNKKTNHATLGVPFPPVGSPSTIPKVKVSSVIKKPLPPPPVSMPGSNLKRAVYYGADLGGCNAWRLGYPSFYMNYTGRAIINELSSMVVDPRFYPGIKSVTVQRQATDVQKAFLHFIKAGGRELGFKINYEIDDIVFKEDIPDYNRCKFAFEDPKIRSQIQEMMGMVDEITVTCDFMKEYYKHKTSNKNVSVIPNYLPKFWADGFYNEEEIYNNYIKNKKRPRILYAGSGTHFDVVNKTGQKDDFEHVIQNIIKARKKYKFVFMGGFPHAVKPYIDNGEMEFVDWVPLLELFSGLHSVGANATYAPLQNNNFNKSKSNIKLLEAGALGLPCVAQDLCTYEKANLKFNTGNDLIDQFDALFKDENIFMEHAKRQRAYTETMWLENKENWMKRYEATFYRVGDPERKYILDTNPEQKTH